MKSERGGRDTRGAEEGQRRPGLHMKEHRRDNRGQRLQHTFVVCAYGESPYLRECLSSLQNQTVRSRILIATSTLNEAILNAAKEYGCKILENHGESGLAGDWNFALRQAKTPLVTLAHQDDVYLPEYTHCIVKAYHRNRDAIILFTDYQELRELPEHPAGLSEQDHNYTAADQDIGKKNWVKTESRLVRTKRLLLLPLRASLLRRSRWIRRRALSLGNVICCPSVTYVRNQMPEKLFAGNMKSNIDWQAWEQLSKRKGSFVYLPEKLMLHRIHGGSTTSSLVNDHARREEDLYMFRKFWPGKVPELIWKAYGKNERYQ